jgi:hypothetical protein
LNPNKDRFPAILDINRPLKRLMPCNSTKKLNIVFQVSSFDQFSLKTVLICFYSLNTKKTVSSSKNRNLTVCLWKHIISIGYGGYIPGIKSENQYGMTYGKHTLASASGDFHRGIDQPACQKFRATSHATMVDHS